MGEKSFIVMLVLFNVIFIAFIGGIIVFIREYRIKKKAHLKEISTIDESHKKELLTTQVEIQTDTMQYIGQEIHDNIGQKLTLASLYAQQLIFENKTPEISESIKGINDIINQSLKELRQLSKSLTDDSVKNNSISELISNECEKVNHLKKSNVQFLNTTAIKLGSYEVKSILYRITQEFLQNSIKHSNCENILVSLGVKDNVIQLMLADDGEGFDIQNVKSNGIGIENIKKRAKLIGGELKLESQKNQGTKLTIEIPF